MAESQEKRRKKRRRTYRKGKRHKKREWMATMSADACPPELPRGRWKGAIGRKKVPGIGEGRKHPNDRGRRARMNIRACRAASPRMRRDRSGNHRTQREDHQLPPRGRGGIALPILSAKGGASRTEHKKTFCGIRLEILLMTNYSIRKSLTPVMSTKTVRS